MLMNRATRFMRARRGDGALERLLTNARRRFTLRIHRVIAIFIHTVIDRLLKSKSEQIKYINMRCAF